MVLVDTSVWIRFVANRVPFAQELDRLLAIDEVAGHEMIYGELLVGGHGERQELLAAYELIHQGALFPIGTSLSSSGIGIYTVAVSAGLTCIC